MIAYEITLNGAPLCTAGIDELGVLTAMLTWVHRGEQRNPETGEPYPTTEFTLDVSALASESREHRNWASEQLQVGDRIEISVRDLSTVDEPASREPEDREELIREAKRLQYEQLKREFEG
ncbi:MAG: hypothetical protein ACYSUQ_10930 [Planctomycetota bacterium]|jgi:hypothetical protein